MQSLRIKLLHEVDGAGELGGVGTTKGELTVRDGLLSGWLEGYRNQSSGDTALLRQVIGDCT
jgi:hypothetical protein